MFSKGLSLGVEAMQPFIEKFLTRFSWLNLTFGHNRKKKKKDEFVLCDAIFWHNKLIHFLGISGKLAMMCLTISLLGCAMTGILKNFSYKN